MSSTAQPEEIGESLQATGTDGPLNLRDTAAERLAAHRNRRAHQTAQLRAQEAEQEASLRHRRENARSEQRRGASVVSEAVRARYERSQSYREFLASEAERALAQAQAEADVAERTARAVADAQMQLLEEIERWREPETTPREQALEAHRDEVRGDLAHALADIALGARELMNEPPYLQISEVPPLQEFPRQDFTRKTGESAASVTPAAAEVSAAGLTVRLYEDLGPARSLSAAPPRRQAAAQPGDTGEELQQLEHEIEFRRSPTFEDHIIETTPIPGNLIEFPRELVAPRRARPRIAEGPLREAADASTPQLRIFEVEPEQEPAPPPQHEAAHAPEWQSLLLEASREPQPVAPQTAQAQFGTEPLAAPLELRVMAAVVDGCLIGVAFVAFAAAASFVAGSGLRELPPAALFLSAFVALAALGLMYQLLFFTFADWTPGMLYARIGLCTFGDRNPSRKAMRRRVFATVLAACPLGLGLLWMWMDDDRLGWHDRMSRMYQRAY